MKPGLYYFISVITGGTLMACELLSARLISPYFGNSLYIWAAIIGTTMMGLAVGYFLAGYFSERNISKKILMAALAAISVYVFLLPYFSSFIQTVFLDFEIRTGIFISTLIFNFPLYLLFGLFSPLIIDIITESTEDTGEFAGRIYGISTLSGAGFILLAGLYFLPEIGTKLSIFFCASLLSIATVLFYTVDYRHEK